MDSIKTVLISTASLPHDGVASWTTRINYLLKRDNEIDYIIGPKSNLIIDKPVQVFIDNVSLKDKFRTKLSPLNRFNPYIKCLRKILVKEHKVILQVKDNLGLLKSVVSFLNKNNLRSRVYVQYHYHTFPPFEDFENLYDRIDELVLLSTSSYKMFKKQCNNIPFPVHINNNGVNSKVFKPVSKKQKLELRAKHNFSDDKILFIWCSQNRKKKGLDLTLRIWDILLKQHRNIELLIIGVDNNELPLVNTRVLGMMDNSELVEYYQLSDFYLFPSLCQEGFGLSLLEAIKCGCYVIAANNGAIPEVTKYGTYAKLIMNPNYISEWVSEVDKSINEYIQNQRVNPYAKDIPENLFDIEDWYERYNRIAKEAKINFKHRYYI